MSNKKAQDELLAMNKLKKLLNKHEITNTEFAKYCGIGERTARRYVNLSMDSVVPVKYIRLAKAMIEGKKIEGKK